MLYNTTKNNDCFIYLLIFEQKIKTYFIMKTQENKDRIKELVIEMINDSNNAMLKKIDRVLNSGCIDVEAWSEEFGKMITPKCIVIALLESEAGQYSAKGTSFEKRVSKEVKNIKMFI